jgi:urease accessory protein UreF
LVFGYAGAVLAIAEEMVVAAFLHQAVATVVSSAQRLLPVGQRQPYFGGLKQE